jgi:hypothetical protein
MDERHANFVVRSLSSSQYFGNNRNEIQDVASLQGAQGSDSVQSTSENQAYKSLLLNPRNTENMLRKENILSFSSRSASAFVKNERLNPAQDAAFLLWRSTLSSPTAYRTLLYDPLSSCYGLSPYKTHQADARMFFSTKMRRPGTSARIPTPKSPSPPEQSLIKSITSNPMSVARKGLEQTWSITNVLVSFLIRLPGNTSYYVMNSKERKARITEIRDLVKKEFDHYWTGSKVRKLFLGTFCLC